MLSRSLQMVSFFALSSITTAFPQLWIPTKFSHHINTTSPANSTNATIPTITSSGYATGYPLCNVPGFTFAPGNYTETVEQDSGSTLQTCLEGCGAAYPGCQSIAFEPSYTTCLWYNQQVQGTQLQVTEESRFDHYDLGCDV